MAVEVFDIHSSTTVLNLVSTFGASKAIANIFAGPLADKFGRKPTLILGFLIGLPVMPYVNIANKWSAITTMNIAFGFSQGLLGSSLFFMLIDVLGPKRRGIAVGLGECTIYVSTAVVNVLAGYLATQYGYRPIPFMVASAFSVIGLLSTIPLHDTLDQVHAEQSQQLCKIRSSIRNNIEQTQDDDIEERPGTSTETKRIIVYSYLHEDETSFASSIEDDARDFLEKKPIANVIRPPTALGVTSAYRITTKSVANDQLECDDNHDADAKDLEETSITSYRMYASMEDSDSDDDSDENEDSEKENDDTKWGKLDENIRASITKIPSRLQVMIGRIPDHIGRFHSSKMRNNPQRRTLGSNSFDNEDTSNNVLTPNETTPLSSHRYGGQFSYDDASDDSDGEVDDSETNKVEQLDELEHDIKTMYPSAFQILVSIMWENPNYGLLCLAGMAMNFKDGFAWGSFPLFFSNFHNLSDDHTDMLVAIYPLCWGFAQAFTGALSDIYGRSMFLLGGFGACTIGTALFFIPGFVWGRPADDNPQHIVVWVIADIFLGLGTAMAYPALQAAVADEVLPVYRGLGLGFYRFIRDMGYVVGALICGSLTDILGYPVTFLIVSGVLGASFLLILFFYR